MRIENNRLVSYPLSRVDYRSTTKKSPGVMTPKFLVIHYTAGASYEADVATLTTASTPASAHLVIGREPGQITQIEDFRTRLWHAGPSSYGGFNMLNGHSIGIEVCSPGPVTRVGEGRYRTWFNRIIVDDDNRPKVGDNFDVIEARHGFLGGPVQHWAMFNEFQIQALLDIGGLLMRHYNLREAVGHDQIATPMGRKVDPGPCCPPQVLSRLNEARTGRQNSRLETVTVVPQVLNFRNSPNGNVIGQLSQGTTLYVLSKTSVWWQVETEDGRVGWVHSNFIRKG